MTLHDISPKAPALDEYLPGLVAPFAPSQANALGGTGLANRIVASRVIVPKEGVLTKFSFFVGTSSGNVIGAVYDTGDASAGNRTKLWDSGSVAMGTGNNYQTLGDPNIAVKAGQALDFAIMLDNTTGTYARLTLAQQAQALLPTGFLPVAGGASPKIQWANNAASFAMPASIAEASCSVSLTGQFPYLFALVS